MFQIWSQPPKTTILGTNFDFPDCPKITVFWDVTPTMRPCYQCFGWKCCLHHQGLLRLHTIFIMSCTVRQQIVPKWWQAIRHTTRHHIPHDSNIHTRHKKSLKPHILSIFWWLYYLIMLQSHVLIKKKLISMVNLYAMHMNGNNLKLITLVGCL
jgi:hypothetical protein